MFANRYFPSAYFGPRYWGKVGHAPLPPLVAVVGVGDGGGVTYKVSRPPVILPVLSLRARIVEDDDICHGIISLGQSLRARRLAEFLLLAD